MLPQHFSLPSDGPGIVRLSSAAPSMYRTDRDINMAFNPLCHGLDHERIWTLALNADMRAIEAREVARGSSHQVAVDLASLIKPAVMCGARYLVMLHNHPNNDPVPSLQDVYTTLNVMDACRWSSVQVVEHMVITPSGRFTPIVAADYLTRDKVAALQARELMCDMFGFDPLGTAR